MGFEMGFGIGIGMGVGFEVKFRIEVGGNGVDSGVGLKPELLTSAVTGKNAFDK